MGGWGVLRLAAELSTVIAVLPAVAVGQEYPARYSADQLARDFAVFESAIREAHGGLYEFRDSAAIERVLKRESGRLAEGGEASLYRAIARVISEIQDGHSRVFLSEGSEQHLDSSPAFLPFQIRVLGGRAFLTQDYSQGYSSLLGSEITAMDGRPWPEVEARLLDHLASDGESRNGELFLLENPVTFGRLYQVLFGPTDRVSLDLRKEDAPEVVAVDAVTRRQPDATRDQRYPTGPRFRLTFSEDPTNTAIMGIGGFYGDGYVEFIEDAFVRIREAGSRNLVIDLRGNPGGHEPYGQRLVSHLTREAFPFYELARINRTGFASLRLSNWAGRTYAPEDAIPTGDGRFRLTESYYDFLARSEPRDPYFGGDVYVLADGGSFSTTTDTMTRLHQMGRATFIGVEAGGSYYGNTSGDTAILTLPHTKIRVRIPLVRFYNDAEGYEPRNRGLVPDHRVEPTIGDLMEGRDPALEKAMELIRSKAPTR